MVDVDDSSDISLDDKEGLLLDQSPQQWLNQSDYSADSSDYHEHLASCAP